ncbi:MAG: triose-phosphate isomerase family protein, partial [Candidatus Acidiferrales bacterium]
MSTAKRRRVIAGNWKMYKNQAETRNFFWALKPMVAGVSDCDIVIAPPFTNIPEAVKAAEGSAIKISSQDVFWEKEGAFTGQISTGMLVEAGCRYAIIGHSERRQFFGETNETVFKKTKSALAAGLTPIVCIGEMLADREAGNTEKVIAAQFQG